MLLTVTTAFAQTLNVAKFKAENDWKTIVETSKAFTEKLVASNIDVRNIKDFRNADFLNTIGITMAEFESDLKKVSDAGKRLNEKYQMKDYDLKCKSCEIDQPSKLSMMNNSIESFRKDKLKADVYFANLIESDPSETLFAAPKCTWQFYLCITVCAATIEFFPIYLACCALCMSSYCKNPPPPLNL